MSTEIRVTKEMLDDDYFMQQLQDGIDENFRRCWLENMERAMFGHLTLELSDEPVIVEAKK